MDINTTPTQEYEQMPTITPPAPKKSKSGMMLWIILGIIIALAAGIAAGYYYADMNKKQEVEAAKTTVKEATLKETAATLEQAKAEAKKKTVTETTCNADELALSIAPSGNSGAGTIVYSLVFTNISKRTCMLNGFPGVSLVNENGNQIGTPADRATNYKEASQNLAPNAKVKAELSTANASNFTDGQCKTGATRLRVYPPNDVGYLSVPSPVTSWCPGFQVSPVLPM